jgi:hypothetical protein
MFPAFLGPAFPAKRLIEQMLGRKPAERGTPTSIMSNSKWFRGYDWDALLSKTYTPKYIPKLKPVNLKQPPKESLEANFVRDEKGYVVKPPKSQPPTNWDELF